MKTVIKKRKDGSRRVVQHCVGPSLTEQSHAESTDIRVIMSNYRRTGLMPQRTTPAMYGDFCSCEDFHAAQNRVLQAQASFMDIPSEIRAKFDNDPGKFLAWINDPRNIDEARDIGLLPPERPDPGQQPSKAGKDDPEGAEPPQDQKEKPPEPTKAAK